MEDTNFQCYYHKPWISTEHRVFLMNTITVFMRSRGHAYWLRGLVCAMTRLFDKTAGQNINLTQDLRIMFLFWKILHDLNYTDTSYQWMGRQIFRNGCQSRTMDLHHMLQSCHRFIGNLLETQQQLLEFKCLICPLSYSRFFFHNFMMCSKLGYDQAAENQMPSTSPPVCSNTL